MSDESHQWLPHLESRDLRTVVGIWAVWGLGVLAIAAAAAALPVPPEKPWPPEMTAEAPPLARWDAGWYYSVARDGYRYDAAAGANNVHFYPLYPILIGQLSRLTGIPIFQVGIGVSLASLLGALLLLADSFSQWGGRSAVLPGIAALLLFPTSYYLASVYTESLFLLETVAALWAARRGWWGLAGLAGAAAGLTRLNGCLILVPLIYFAWRETEKGRHSITWRPALALGGSIFGALAYPLYLWRRFGDPLLYFRYQDSGWPHRPTPIWSLARALADHVLWDIRHATEEHDVRLFAKLLCLALFLVLTLWLFIEHRTGEGLYAAATILLLLNSGSLGAIERYVLILFPCFFLLGEFLRRRPVLAFAYAFAGLGLFVILLTRFVHWQWVA